MAKIAVGLIKLYQWCISPLIGRHCRFHPSCSNYAIEAFARHGFVKGLFLSIWRILRCQPLCEGGYDPVPTEFNFFRKRQSLS